MKRIALLFLTFVLILSSCQESGTSQHISVTIADELAELYKPNEITDWKTVVAVCRSEDDISGFDLNPSEGETVSDKSGYIIALHEMQKSGLDVPDCSALLDSLASSLSDSDAMTTLDVSYAIIALSQWERELDEEGLAAALISRQDTTSGGFYTSVDKGGVSRVDLLSTAAAYTAMLVLKAESSSTDSALLCLGTLINDDNTLSDADGKESCLATAEALTAMLASGIPTDGDISTALLNAVYRFRITGSSRFTGYADHKGESASDAVNASVYLCAVSAIYGNPFVK